MPQVSIIISENTTILPRITDLLLPPKTKEQFTFQWHQSVGEYLRHDNVHKIPSETIFQKYQYLLSGQLVDSWDILSDDVYAIIILDMNYPDLILTEPQITELEELLTQANVQEALWQDVTENNINRDQSVGFYLLAKALSNQHWKGVIAVSTFASDNAFTTILDSIVKHINNDKVTVYSSGGAISSQNYNSAKNILDKAIDTFLKKFSNVENRLWTFETKKWFNTEAFESSTTDVPHNLNQLENDTTRKKDCKNDIKQYLHHLLGFEPPKDWFDDEQKFKVLFYELQHLTGSKSVAQGGNEPLKLSNVMLLLAIAISEKNIEIYKNTQKAENFANQIDWWQESWQQSSLILPAQTSEKSKEAILALIEMFKTLAIHDFQKEKGEYKQIIEKANLTKLVLQITFDHDFKRQIPEKQTRPTLIDKMLKLPEPKDQSQSDDNNADQLLGLSGIAGDGQVYKAYRQFLIASSDSQRGKESKCVINLYTFDDHGKTKSKMEIRSCAN